MDVSAQVLTGESWSDTTMQRINITTDPHFVRWQNYCLIDYLLTKPSHTAGALIAPFITEITTLRSMLHCAKLIQRVVGANCLRLD